MGELQATQGNDVAAPVEGSIGSQIDAADIMIPKILLMQSISELVDKRKAQAGDFVHSLDETVIGTGEDKPVEVIVLSVYKTLQTWENGNYVKTESWKSEFKGLPWEEVVNGVKVNRKTTLNFYVLRTEDIENMTVFPYVVTFKSTSFKGGKKLNTKLLMLDEFGASPWAKTFKLVAKQEENDKGRFYVLDVVDGEKTTEVQQAQAKKWFERLKVEAVAVHEDEETTAAAAGSDNIDF